MPIIEGFDDFKPISGGSAGRGVLEGFDDFKVITAPQPKESSSGDVMRGIKQSGHELAGTAYGLAGLAGAGLGAEGLKQWGLENAKRKFDESSALGKDVYSLEGISSVGDAIDYLQHGVGYVGAQAIPAILTGGVGSSVAKKFVEQGVKELAKKTVAGSAAEQAAILAAKQQVAKASTRGAIGGMGLSSYAQEAGSIYPEMVAEGHDEPGRAALFALPAAALDVIPEARAAKQLIMPGAKKGILKEIRNQALGESLTEGAQTGIERAAAYKPLTGSEAMSEYANAMALGALGGGIMGGIGAKLGNPAHEVNLLGTATPTTDDQVGKQPLLGIGYSPLPGTPRVFPDGTVALNQEQELQKRYNIPAAAPAVSTATEITDALTQAASDHGLNLTSKKGTPIQQRIDLFTKAVDLAGNELITQDQLAEVAAELKKNRYGSVGKTLAQIEADATKEQQNVGTTVPTDTGVAPSVVAGGDVLSGGVAPTGSNAAVTEGGGGVGGVAPIAPSSGPEVSLLGSGANQQAPVVGERAPSGTTLEQQLGLEETPEVDPLVQIFGERDAGVIRDFNTGMTSADVAAKYGMSEQNVRKIAGAAGERKWAGKIAAAKSKYGYTDAQLADMLRPYTGMASEAEQETGAARATYGAPISEEEAAAAGLIGAGDAGVGTIGGSKGKTKEKNIEKVYNQYMDLLEEKSRIDDLLAEASDEELEIQRAEIDKRLEQIQAVIVAAQGREKVAVTLSEAQQQEADAKREAEADQIEAEAAREVDYIDEGDIDELRMHPGELTFIDGDGKPFKASETALDLIARFPGVQRMLDTYAANGLSHVLNSVSGWYLTANPVNWEGAFTMRNGKPVIIVNYKTLMMEDKMEWTAHHELAHAVDLTGTQGDGVYSGNPMMDVSIKNDTIVPQGAVMQEAYDFWVNDGSGADSSSDFGRALNYPFNRQKYPEFTSKDVREELFAQLWAQYNTREGRAFLEDNLPTAADFMENVYAHVQQAQYNASGAVQQSGQGQAFRPSAKGDGKSGQVQRQPVFRQSRQENIVEQVARRIGGATGQMVYTDAAEKVKNLTQSMAFLHDLVDKYKDAMPSVSKWYKSMQDVIATRSQIEQKAEIIASAAGKLKNGTDRVNKFLAETTLSQNEKYEDTPEFKALTPEEQSVVQSVFAYGADMLKVKQDILKSLGLEKVFSSISTIKGPYAPLKRFGDYVAVLKSKELLAAEDEGKTSLVNKLKADGNHYVMATFDTLGQAERFAEENRGKYDFSDAFRKSARVAEDRPMNNELLQRVLAAVKMDTNVTAEAKTAMSNLIQDMYFQSLDEQDARMSGLKRKGVSGYDTDMMRSFLSHARAEAGFLANVKHGGDVNTHFYAMQKEVKTASGKRENQDAFNILAEHYAESLSYKDTPIQDRLMALTSSWQLATSIGYHVTNAMQGIMTSIPKLASDFNNYPGAWKALLEGYGTLKDTGMWGNIDLTKVKDEGLRGALQRAADMRVLDVGLTEDLTHFEAFRTGVASIDKTSELARTALHKLSQVSRAVETANRISSATAGYKMALASGKTVEQAQEYAVRILQTTQGDFSRTGAPLLLKKLPKVVTQYRKYQFMMGALYVKAFNEAFRSTDPTTRAIGQRMLAYKLGHASVAAGVLGLPMMNLVSLVFSALAGDDEPVDLERSLREAIGDEDMADLLLHGPLAYMGLDMSAKLGEDKIFSILPYTDVDLTSPAGLAKTALGVAGPAAAQLGKFADGIGYFERGDYAKGAEKFLPKGLADGLKAFRLANEGFTLKNGDVMYTPDDMNEFALALDAIGMPSTSLRKMEWMRSQQYQIKRFYVDRSKEIEQAYAKAYKDEDYDTMDDLRDQWMNLQEGKVESRRYFNDRPEALKKQPLSVLLKYPQTSRKREEQLQKSAD